jgi:hypothetical protein
MDALCLLATMLYALVWYGCYRLLVKHPADIFAVTLYVTAYLFVLRPLVLALGIDDPYPQYLFGDHRPLLIEAELFGILWLVSMIAGTRFGNGFAPVVAPAFPRADGLPSTRKLLLISVVMTAATVGITLYLLQQYGSFSGLMRAVKVEKALAGLYFLRQVGSLAVFISLATVLCAIARNRMHDRVRETWIVVLGLACFIFGIACTYAWGNRMSAAFGTLGLVLGLMSLRRSFSWVRFALSVGVILALLTGLRLVRDLSTAGRMYTIEQADGNAVQVVMVSTHGTRFDALMLLLRDIHHLIPVRWGLDFYYGLLSIVPRLVWDEKPAKLFPGEWFRQVYEPAVINGWPFTTPGEWLVNFGLLGLVFGGILSGVVFRGIQLRYSDIATNPFTIVLTLIVGGLVFDHGVNTLWLQSYVWWIPPLFILTYYVRSRQSAMAAGRPYPA